MAERIELERQVEKDQTKFPFPVTIYRFDQKNEMFKRSDWDEEIKPYGKRLYKEAEYGKKHGFRKL